MASESENTRKLCKMLNEMVDTLAISVVGTMMGNPGVPDRYISSRKWQGWVEFKGPSGRLTPQQHRVCTMLHKVRPGQVFVVRWECDEWWGCVEDVFGRRLAVFGYGAGAFLDALVMATKTTESGDE